MRMLKQLIGHKYPKNINEIIKESIKLRYPFQHFATLIISQRDIIKGITQSKPNNLILANYGLLLAGLLRAPVAGVTQINTVDISGAVDAVNAMGLSQLFNEYSGADKVGSYMQVGSGTTPATRADYDIETALGTAPENALFDTGTGSYAVGSIACAGAIVSGGAGTINETGLFGRWMKIGGTYETYMLLHDILVSGEAFILGNTITVAYTINL